ncbi:hypothetical protein D3C83_211060 [compost metagenome]
MTREAVLASLWTFKGETLGGLTSPLTFVKGEKAPRQRCWLTLVIQDKQFRLQRNGQYVCQ